MMFSVKHTIEKKVGTKRQGSRGLICHDKTAKAETPQITSLFTAAGSPTHRSRTTTGDPQQVLLINIQTDIDCHLLHNPSQISSRRKRNESLNYQNVVHQPDILREIYFTFSRTLIGIFLSSCVTFVAIRCARCLRRAS